MTLAQPHTRFERPPGSDAVEPPEAHGVSRDGVKLMVATPDGVVHGRFADLGEHLRPGRSAGREQFGDAARRGHRRPGRSRVHRRALLRRAGQSRVGRRTTPGGECDRPSTGRRARRAHRAARRRRALCRRRPSQTGRGRQSAVGRTVGDRGRRHVVPQQARAAYPVQLRPAALAAEQLSDGLRPPPRQR